MASNFFNTINLSGKDLERANARAAAQEKLIESIFKANPGRKLSPSQVHTIMQIKYDLHPPLTSIRRGMTNLTMEKFEKVLTKLDEKIESPYASLEHLWILSGTTENLYQKNIESAGDIASKIIKVTQSSLF